MELYLIAFFIFAAVVCAVSGMWLTWGSRRETVTSRIDQISRIDHANPNPSLMQSGDAERGCESVIKRLLAAAEKILSASALTKRLHDKLSLAGYRSPSALVIFVAVKIAFAVSIFISVSLYLLATEVTMNLVVLMGIPVILLGLKLPDVALSGLVKRRKEKISGALSDALDLLVVCVEAGLGLDASLLKISEEIHQVAPELSDELQIVNLEVRAGKPRAEALRHLSERTGVEDVKSLVAKLIQTDKLGTSIAKSLRTHAQSLRISRRQRIEAAAAKTGVKLLFPLVFFIFPALFVVVLGPAIIQLVRTLSSR